MSTFSSLFQSGTAFYGDPFGPIIDVITDWGWSLLPQFPGSIRPGPSAGSRSQPQPTQATVLPPIPVAYEDYGAGVEGSPVGVRPVRTGYEPTRRVEVPREVVVVGDVATEVEHHPEGDFPAGSIFAPGQTWGGIHELDREEPEVDVSFHAGLLDWGIDTLLGRQDWQMGGFIGGQTGPMFAAGVPATVPPPSGIPGQPTTIYGYKEGRAVTSGDSCGNRRYVTLDRETGKISCKRRRRRRLLTNRDLADLASLKTITGGGAALNSAVIRAVR